MLVTSSSLTASGVMAKSEAFWTEIVEPSGSALATSAAASAPLAPSRLMTGKEPPSSSVRPWEIWRLIRSEEPPAEAPTGISTAPDGYSPLSLPPPAVFWTPPQAVRARAAAAATAARLRLRLLLAS